MPISSRDYRKRDDYSRVFGLGGSSVIVGKTAAAHAKGAMGTIKIYTGAKGSETDTGRTQTNVYNRFAALEADKWVLFKHFGGGWELIAGEC